MRVRSFYALALLAGVACTPKIGDKCQISTDCSVRGDRLCDISQPGGYCTQLNCQSGTCPADEGSCVLFESAVPGCAYDDRSGLTGSRTARSFCVANCTSSSDCRAGYVCADARTAPWNATILDDDQTKLTCLPGPIVAPDGGLLDGGAPDAAVASFVSPPVCNPFGPTVAPINAGPSAIHDASVDLPPLVSPSSTDAGH